MKKKIIFTIVLYVLIFSLFVGFELFLRSTDTYKDYHSAFIEVGQNGTHLNYNSRWAKQFFFNFRPASAYNPVSTEKSNQQIRIVVLGGSTTAGFPYSFHNAFPAYLQQKLQVSNPHKQIQVINLGQTALNSYSVAELSEELGRIQPDAAVIHMGHNEFYGAYGAASTNRPLFNNPIAKRLLIDIQQTGLFFYGKRLYSYLFMNEESRRSDRSTMAAMIRETTVPKSSNLFKSAIEAYQTNVTTTIEHLREQRIPVVLSTVTSNISGQPPLGDHQQSDSLFHAGRLALDEGDLSQAKKLFYDAKETDPLRFRAPEEINTILRTTATNYNIHLLDADSLLREQPAYWHKPDSLFTDHLHFTTSGYHLLAEFTARTLPDALMEISYSPTPYLNIQPDEYDQTLADTFIKLLLNNYPFVSEDSNASYSEQFQNAVTVLKTGNQAEQAVAQTLTEGLPHKNQYQHLLNVLDDTSHQLTHARGHLYWNPFSIKKHGEIFNLGVHQLEAFPDLGLPLMLDLFRYQTLPDRASYLNATAAFLLKLDQPGQAILWLNVAENEFSKNKSILYNLARAHLMAGDTTKSRQYFRRFQSLP